MVRDHRFPVGHLWKKEDRNGKSYLAGVLSLGILGEIPIVVFEESSKDRDGGADYTIRMASDRER